MGNCSAAMMCPKRAHGVTYEEVSQWEPEEVERMVTFVARELKCANQHEAPECIVPEDFIWQMWC